MNGEIDVQSALGEGSVFTVTLPFEVAEGGSARAASPTSRGWTASSSARTSNADDLRAYLEHAGARVHRVPPSGRCGAAARARWSGRW